MQISLLSNKVVDFGTSDIVVTFKDCNVFKYNESYCVQFYDKKNPTSGDMAPFVLQVSFEELAQLHNSLGEYINDNFCEDCKVG